METNLLYEDVQLDAQVRISAQGDIVVAPLPWEVVEKAPIMIDDKVTFRASVTLADDGTVEVRRFKKGVCPPRYQLVFRTEHCDVLLSRGGSLVERRRFGKRMTFREMRNARKRELREIDAFFKSL